MSPDLAKIAIALLTRTPEQGGLRIAVVEVPAVAQLMQALQEEASPPPAAPETTTE